LYHYVPVLVTWNTINSQNDSSTRIVTLVESSFTRKEYSLMITENKERFINWSS
jgi:hypothetical protein